MGKRRRKDKKMKKTLAFSLKIDYNNTCVEDKLTVSAFSSVGRAVDS